jgi:hypothetical protein
MFWPVGYLLMLVGLLGVLRNRNVAMVVPSLLLIVGLQYYDTGLLRKKIHTTVAQPAIADSKWEKFIQGVNGVNLHPFGGNGGRYLKSILFFQGIAAKCGRPINMVLLARAQKEQIVKYTIFQAPLVVKNLYVVSEGGIPPSIIDAINHDWCRGSDQGIICVPGSDSQWWQEHGPTFPPLKKLDLPSLEHGLVIDMSKDGNGASLGDGFSGAESWGRWTDGKWATLALDVPRSVDESWRMEVMAQPFASTLNPALIVEVCINGEKIAEWKFTDASQQKCVAIIPGDLLKKAKYTLKGSQQLALIEFSIHNPISPRAVGTGSDTRELGLGISKLTFSRVSEAPTERIHEMQ